MCMALHLHTFHWHTAMKQLLQKSSAASEKARCQYSQRLEPQRFSFLNTYLGAGRIPILFLLRVRVLQHGLCACVCAHVVQGLVGDSQ